MKNSPSVRLSARERLLAAASELFYQEGIHVVGIDRIIEKAGVAKASLYSTFGSKDELIRAYLEIQHQNWLDRYRTGLKKFETPRDRLLGMFDILGERIQRVAYHGCAFINACAEEPSGSTIEDVSDVFRSSMHQLFTELAIDAGIETPESLARQLVLLHDGATVSARMDHNVSIIQDTKDIAARLIDDALHRCIN